MIAIRICLVEQGQQASLDILLGRLRRVFSLRAPSLLHRINEVCCLLIAKVFQRSDVECGHHVMIFMNQVVAVEHVHTIPRSVLGQDLYLLVDTEQHYVFESNFLVFQDRAFAIYTAHYLEVDEVDVHWM